MLCSIPTQGHFSFVVPCSTSNALRWIEVKILKIPQQSSDTQGGAAVEAVTEQKLPISALSLQEIRFVPAMRGMRRASESLEISPHFWFEMKDGKGYYEIRSPFEGLPQALIESLQLDVVLDGDAGIATLFWGSESSYITTRGKHRPLSFRPRSSHVCRQTFGWRWTMPFGWIISLSSRVNPRRSSPASIPGFWCTMRLSASTPIISPDGICSPKC